MKKVKIVATLGPSSNDKIEHMIKAGVDVFRLNFSHADHKTHRNSIKLIRSIAKKLDSKTAILQDISGPKIRIGEINGFLELKRGDKLRLVKNNPESSYDLTLTYPEIIDHVNIGEYVFFADGSIRTKVIDKDKNSLILLVKNDGVLSSRKGVNFPHSKLKISSNTQKDEKDINQNTITNLLAAADILVSTGGVSVGDYDFVKDIVPRLGADVVFKGVGIKPGRHIMVAKKQEKFILALPGFAYSSTVTAILYALPLVAKMLGRDKPFKTVAAKLQGDFTKRSRFTEFTACNVVVEDGEYYVNFDGKKVGSSAILTNMLNESALMIAGEDDKFLESGTYVSVILMDNF